jgi:hypothetical protein
MTPKEKGRLIEMVNRIEKENYGKEMHYKTKEFYNHNKYLLVLEGVKFD